MMMGSCALLSAGIVAVTLKEPQRGAKEEDLKEVLSKGKPLQNVDVSLPVSPSLRLSISLPVPVPVSVCVLSVWFNNSHVDVYLQHLTHAILA